MPAPGPPRLPGPGVWPPAPEPVPVGENIAPYTFPGSTNLDSGIVNQRLAGDLPSYEIS